MDAPELRRDDVPGEVNRISGMVVDAAIHVHGRLGPGLLEKTYRVFLAAELTRRGLRAVQRVKCPVLLDGIVVAHALELDILVEDCVVIGSSQPPPSTRSTWRRH